MSVTERMHVPQKTTDLFRLSQSPYFLVDYLSLECSMSITKGATGGAGTSYPTGVFIEARVCLIYSFQCSILLITVCHFVLLFHCFVMSFDFMLLIGYLVFSKLSYRNSS